MLSINTYMLMLLLYMIISNLHIYTNYTTTNLWVKGEKEWKGENVRDTVYNSNGILVIKTLQKKKIYTTLGKEVTWT